MIDSSIYPISRLDETFITDDFDCGESSLNSFLKKYALTNQKNGIGNTYVLHENKNNIILGYYTISVTNVSKEKLPSQLVVGFPNYPLPSALLARLAIDNDYKGKNFGKYLLYDALKNIKQISGKIGCYAVVVDALNHDVVKWYKKYGFIEYLDEDLKLFLPIAGIPSL